MATMICCATLITGVKMKSSDDMILATRCQAFSRTKKIAMPTDQAAMYGTVYQAMFF